MSYCFDVLARAYAEQIRPKIEEEAPELALAFGLVIEAMHDANHRLGDAVNHDARVAKTASRLDAILNQAGG